MGSLIRAADGDRNAEVQRTSLQSLCIVAPAGDKDACKTMVRRLKDKDDTVRSEALEGLEALAIAGDSQLVDLAGALLGYSSKDVRKAGLEALGLLATPGDTSALGHALKNLHHGLKPVRDEMREAVAQLGGAGKAEVVAAVLLGLKSERYDIREAAILSLTKFASPGDSEVTTQLCDLARMDPEPRNRYGAMEALGTVGKGRKIAVKSAVIALTEIDGSMRATAADTLKVLAESAEGDEKNFVIDSVVSKLALREIPIEDRPVIRKSVLVALEKVGRGSSHEGAVTALVKRLDDQDAGIRTAALGCLEQVAKRGDKAAIQAVATLFTHHDRKTRELAGRRYKFFSELGDKFAAEAAARQSVHPFYEIRLLALRALASVLKPEDPESRAAIDDRVIGTVLHLYKEDDYPAVRMAAEYILYNIENGHAFEGRLDGVFDGLEPQKEAGGELESDLERRGPAGFDFSMDDFAGRPAHLSQSRNGDAIDFSKLGPSAWAPSRYLAGTQEQGGA